MNPPREQTAGELLNAILSVINEFFGWSHGLPEHLQPPNEIWLAKLKARAASRALADRLEAESAARAKAEQALKERGLRFQEAINTVLIRAKKAEADCNENAADVMRLQEELSEERRMRGEAE